MLKFCTTFANEEEKQSKKYKIVKEIWNDIEGFEGVYQVSNLGRIKSLDRYVNGRINGRKSYIKGCFLTPLCGCGRRKKYLQVNLCVNGKCKKYSIHQLVAKAFIIEKKLVLNYILNDESDFKDI